MILGLLSDTHGQVQRAAAAVRVLREAGAEAFIHCGDIGGPEVLDQLAGLRAWVVWGNTDWPDTRLSEHAARLGLSLASDAPCWIELEGRVIAAFHGHEPTFKQLLDHAPGTGKERAALAHADFVVHGHTHIAADVRLGPLRLVNPGALDGTPRLSVATVDLKTKRVRFLRVGDDRRAARGYPAR